MATTLDNKTDLGKAILRRLYLNGKNQAWLSEQTGISRSYISVICKKPMNIKIDTLIRISNALDVELGELISKSKSERN